MKYYTVKEATKILRICNAGFYNLINAGELKTFKVGRRRLISEKAIRDFVKQKEAEDQEADRG